VAGLLLPASHATAEHEPPLTSRDFAPLVAGPSVPGDPFTQGFGDRDNSWTWSMKWWKGKLFVGTSRAYRCFSRASLARIAGFLFPYPPPDKDQNCDTDPAMLPLQAEIWAWTPQTAGGDPRGSWERVFQSPKDVPVPGRPDTFVSYDVGFRGMEIHTGKDGIERLFAVGVNSAALWDGTNVVPPPRILYTESGDSGTWKPLPQEPGTYFGDLSKGSFRSPASFNGKFFVLHGTIQGGGILLASEDPLEKESPDTWFLAAPANRHFFEMEVFNGWLYLGGQDYKGGYTVIKTKAVGDPYEFTTVVPGGALLKPRAAAGRKPSASVVSMHVFEGRLYVGTDNPAELIRINPDDTWDLLVGTPRRALNGEWIYPLSGLEDGFAHQFNDHIWRQGSRDGFLYAGTYDATINWKDDPQVGPRFRHLQGTDIYRTADGWYWTPITMTGFGDSTSPGPNDPRPDPNVPVQTGGRFNFGTRSFANTPFGLFLGTANDFYGLHIYRANPPAAGQQLYGPPRADVEIYQKRPVVSWDPVPGAARYRVMRALMDQVQLRPFPLGQQDEEPAELAAMGIEVQASGVTDAEVDTPVTTDDPLGDLDDSDNPDDPEDLEDPAGDPSGGGTGTKKNRLATWIHRPFQHIATTANPVFVDEPLASGERRLYLVIAEDAQGRTSETSNLVQAPMLIPPAKFTHLLTRMNTLQRRGMFTSQEMVGASRYIVQQASGLAVANRMNDASELLDRLRLQVIHGRVVYYPEAKDLEIAISRLIRRMKLVHNGYVHQAALFT
jgi:hypothetical protein